MDSHISGPASLDNGHGSIPCMRAMRTLFGTTPAGDRILLKTVGASVSNPLLVELFEFAQTAFNGTGPIVTIFSTDLAGGTSTIGAPEFQISDIAAAAFKNRVIIVDRIYYVRYTIATGAPTTGDIYSFARVAGNTAKSGT